MTNTDTLIQLADVVVPVEQIDRDAAVMLATKIARTDLERIAISYIAAGRGDDSAFAQAFAKHRLCVVAARASQQEKSS